MSIREVAAHLVGQLEHLGNGGHVRCHGQVALLLRHQLEQLLPQVAFCQAGPLLEGEPAGSSEFGLVAESSLTEWLMSRSKSSGDLFPTSRALGIARDQQETSEQIQAHVELIMIRHLLGQIPCWGGCCHHVEVLVVSSAAMFPGPSLRYSRPPACCIDIPHGTRSHNAHLWAFGAGFGGPDAWKV